MMRRANSVIQQDRMRKRDELFLENALLSRRKKLNVKSRRSLLPALNVTFDCENPQNSQNVRRYPLRGYNNEKSSQNTKKVSSLPSSPKRAFDIRISQMPFPKRKKVNSTPMRKPRRRKHTRIRTEESFACSDPSDEEMLIKRKKFYTVQNGEQCAEMYKTDFGYQDDGSDFSSDEDDLVRIKDRWREEWNQGVQVPVNKQLPEFVVRNVPCSSASAVNFKKSFQMPDRLIAVHNRKYVNDSFVRITMPPLCQYHCDQTDLAFLHTLNQRRSVVRLPPVELKQFAAIMEKFEVDCYQAIHHDLLAPVTRRRDADHDEETCCEICGQADYEEDDPIVFCEICMVPVHQSCYGVEVLPKGDWICDVCSDFDSAPVCVFCPFAGGAMKMTEDCDTWAHISCALWIPEVRFGNHVRREPITRIDDVPNGRWNLRCSVCDTSAGACIQCSHDSCATAFHVTCALRQKFVMRIEHAGTENVRMLSFCNEHSKPDYQLSRSHKATDNRRVREKRVVEKMEEDFFLYVSPEVISQQLNIREELVDELYEYWKLKRADNGNRVLLTDRSLLESRVASELSLLFRKRLNVGYELRHDLEKVRILCHMVRLRERQKIQMFTLLRNAYNVVFECIAHSHVPLSGRVLNEYREKLNVPYFNDSLKNYFSNQFMSPNTLEKLLHQRFGLTTRSNHFDNVLQGYRACETARSPWRKKNNDLGNHNSKTSNHCSRTARRRLNLLNLTF